MLASYLVDDPGPGKNDQKNLRADKNAGIARIQKYFCVTLKNEDCVQ